jgi:hypothetical protein
MTAPINSEEAEFGFYPPLYCLYYILLSYLLLKYMFYYIL